VDGRSFDEISRSVGTGVSRRRVLAGLAAGALAGIAAKIGTVAQGCTRYGRPCTGQTCCNGAACQGGVCRCPAGTSVCNTLDGPACVACPPGQILGAGCRCLCATTGREAGECCADADCGPNAVCQDRVCLCAPAACPRELGFAGRDPATGTCVCSSSNPVDCGALCCPAGETCVPTPDGGVQCSGESRAGRNDCGGGCRGCDEHCANPPAGSPYAPGSTCCARPFDFTCCPPEAICTPFGGCCCPAGADCPGVRGCDC
jgi:hypothetical protein